MATTLQTFIDIFDRTSEDKEDSGKLKEIVIPIIQRDYAQGRDNDEIKRVRNRFLDALYKAVTGSPIILDFVYGDIDKTGRMTPLDGQQRLTTLFLLHWYAVKKSGLQADEYEFLKHFSYETRYSARDFCARLVDFNPSFTENLESEIVDQYWFPLEWKKDPTIKSMLVMLNAIHDKFSDIDDLWEKLKDGAIRFYFLPIKDMGLTDELYIKMNSRGKPLTRFEHFKAELQNALKSIDSKITEQTSKESNIEKRIMRKIDIDWTDMLWEYRNKDNIVDDEFLCYFQFICDTLCYRAEHSPQGRSRDEFDLLTEYFSKDSKTTEANIKLLEEFFDCWCNIPNESPFEFLKRFIAQHHEPNKIKVNNSIPINIFKDCLCNYADITGTISRKFTLGKFVLLYAITIYLQYNLHSQDKITERQFVRRLRIINNLIQNSSDELSDSENRTSGNRMPAILKQVDSIILSGIINEALPPNFNAFQIKEEIEKFKWSTENPEKEEDLFALEDHELLYGQISIIGIENDQLFSRFGSLFGCNWDNVDCALLACGEYLQKERNKPRYQLGSQKADSSWKELFHKSIAKEGYENTRKALLTLLSRNEEINDDSLIAISSQYLRDCEERSEYDWRYYYIKYPSFRSGDFGKYIWIDHLGKPYEIIVLRGRSKTSSNSHQPFLYEIDRENINREENGKSLLYQDKLVKCKNSAFVVFEQSTEKELRRLKIQQNDKGIDTEDRIIKGKSELKKLIQECCISE